MTNVYVSKAEETDKIVLRSPLFVELAKRIDAIQNSLDTIQDALGKPVVKKSQPFTDLIKEGKVKYR